MMHLISIFDLIKPIFQFINIVLMLGVTSYLLFSISRQPRLPLILIAIGLVIGIVVTCIWFVFSLQIDWHIELVSQEIRRILYLVISILYPFEIIVWPVAIFMIAKDNLMARGNATEQGAAANP